MPRITERIFDNLKERFEFARTHIKRESIFHHTALILILFLGFATRFFPYFKYEVALKAYDPHSQLRAATQLNELGLRDYWDFIDPTSWYPSGVYYGRNRYLGTPLTAVLIHKTSKLLGLNWSLKFSAYMTPVLWGTLTVLVIYLLGRELANPRVGLISAFILATLPAHTQRTMAGFYDNEAIGIFLMVTTFYLFIRSLRTGSVGWGIASGLSLGALFDSWGAANYPIGLLAIFVFLLIIVNKASDRLFIAYGTTTIIGVFVGTLVPRNGMRLLMATEVLPAYAALLILALFLSLKELQKVIGDETFRRMLIYAAYGISGVLLGGIALLFALGQTPSIASKFVTVMLPFFRADVPILKSVSEHLTLSWGNMFLNIYVLAFLIPVGLYYAYQSPTEKNIFLIVYGLTALYFSGSMVRLVLVLSPVAALLGAKAIDETLIPFALTFQEKFTLAKRKKRIVTGIGNEHVTAAYILMLILLFITMYHGLEMAGGRLAPAEILVAFEQPTGEVTVWGDWQESLMWLMSHSTQRTVVASWWDYGYWITVNSNVTSLCDNATSNSTQIGNVGAMLMSEPKRALEIAKIYDVEYILVNVASGYVAAGSDVGKAIWIMRIAESSSNLEDIDVDDYYKAGKYLGGAEGKFDDSLLWKMITGSTKMQDLAITPDQANSQLTQYELVSDLTTAITAGWVPENDGFREAYTSKHCWVRIYQVNG
jgi:dolichyl-diphosphooligosaccharide--protein glycosyltransferase